METLSFVCPRLSCTPCTDTSRASTSCRPMTSSVSAGASSRCSASLRLSSPLSLPTRTSRYSVQALLLDMLWNAGCKAPIKEGVSFLSAHFGHLWGETGTLWFLWKTSPLWWDESCTVMVLSALSVTQNKCSKKCGCRSRYRSSSCVFL